MSKIFDLEEKRLKKEIVKYGAKRVLIQLPEGLKDKGLDLAKIVEEVGALPILSADPCYGACDLPLHEARTLQADLIVHYGHSEKPYTTQTNVPIIYIEARCMLKVKDSVIDSLSYLKPWCKIGLVTVVQHVHELDETRKLLNEAGKTVMIGDAGRLNYPGQVIGCDYSNAEAISKDVEAFLFVGGGRFHALGLALATMKPVVIANPYHGKAFLISRDDVARIIKQRWITIEQARDARVFGVIIGLKSGQTAIKSAMKILDYLKKDGREVILLAMREVEPHLLEEFPSIEAFVNTACPRISLDEASIFKRPVLTIPETLVLLGKVEWEDLLQRGWFKRFI